MPLIYPDESTMTEGEYDAWVKIEAAANAMFALPMIHPEDNPETVRDIHNLQNRLLARAAYAQEVR